jgi:hypothetical protein
MVIMMLLDKELPEPTSFDRKKKKLLILEDLNLNTQTD